MSKVLVTGSAGMLGQHIAGHLRAQGIDVVDYDLKLGQNIHDTKGLESFMEGCDCVIHLAGIHGPLPNKVEEDYKHDNYEGSMNVIDTAVKMGVKRFVFASSNDVYGFSTGAAPAFPYNDKTKTPPLTKLHPYAAFKLLTEKYLKKSAGKGMSVIAFRFGGINLTDFGWTITTGNIADAFHKAVIADTKGYHQINIANKDGDVDISKAKKLLGYEGGI